MTADVADKEKTSFRWNIFVHYGYELIGLGMTGHGLGLTGSRVKGQAC